MGEDLVLVAGQQDRMLRGADVWAHPVAYDKLGVRYRRWRNSLVSSDPQVGAHCGWLSERSTANQCRYSHALSEPIVLKYL